MSGRMTSAGGAVIALSLAGLATVAAAPAAASTFQVTIDSSSVAGQPGKVAFDLTSPDPMENSVTLTSLVFEGSGAIVSKETTGGQSTGGLFQNDPTSGAIINDYAVGTGGVHTPEFYTNLVLDVTWGTKLSFTLLVTEGATPGAIPDLFALYVLDPATGQPLYATGDPLGTGALFAVSIDATGPCLFLPTSSAVPVKLTLMNEIGEPFSACVQGGMALGKSRIVFSKKRGRDTFAVNATLASSVPLDPAAGGDTFFLSRSGVQFFSASGATLKANKKKTTYRGRGAGLKKLILKTKDHKAWRLTANGGKVDLSSVNTGANETVGVGLQSHTAASPSRFSPPGVATFNGSGTFKRTKRKLGFPR